VPPAGNANFAWVQHIVHHLAPAGVAGFVLANGSMSSNQSGEGEIRKNLVEADLVDCMVALPGQLFYSTQIPACLWFLARDRKNGKFRDRRGHVLFIDARKLGRMVDRTHRELTDEDIARIAGTYHAWRGEKEAGEYADVPGFCKSATLERCASTATCSRPAATSAPRRRRTTASRSRRRCSGSPRRCASSRPRPRSSMPPSPPTARRQAAPGELRTSQNWIGPAGCTLNSAHLRSAAAPRGARALGDLERFLHASDDLPPLVKIALAHVQFETIHPFLDGNGRVGRLLITFLLTERGVLHKPVLYLSHYFKQHRQTYYEHLQAVRDHGDWEAWLAFFLRGVIAVLGRAAGNGHRIMDQLFDHPIVTVARVRDWLGVTSAGANNLVRRLVELGLLREITGYARNRRFRFEPYLRLFEEPVEAES
jgi:hypothetical protein